MKIDEKILSIPPYLSTTWEHVAFLQLEDDALVVSLTNGKSVKVPQLSEEEVDRIFQGHLDFVESEMLQSQASSKGDVASTESASQAFSLANLPFAGSFPPPLEMEGAIGMPLRFGPGGLESLGMAMQHNSAQKDLPDLPPEMLNKIGEVAKVLGASEATALPKPEPHCNCFHCQIARSLQDHLTPAPCETDEIDEEVSDEDLRFCEWRISQNDDKRYTVTNPLDEEEQYQVYLGSPVGCTCGKNDCEHITAVLKS